MENESWEGANADSLKEKGRSLNKVASVEILAYLCNRFLKRVANIV